MFDVVIENGLFFDGTGAPGVLRNVAIAGGRVAAIGEGPLPAARTIDARGAWVMPGFLDVHTHYDAELLAAPALTESIRHGVTTVTVGSCSISTILSEPEDCSDLFTRVESVPRAQVLPLLRERKRWSTPRQYVDFLAPASARAQRHRLPRPLGPAHARARPRPRRRPAGATDAR